MTFPHQPPTREVRLGLVGLGWGRPVAQAIRSLPGVRLAACHARTAAARDAFAGTWDARACSTYEAMLADDSMDGIVIMTPNSTHRELAVAALHAGRHVLVTKPIAATLSDAAAMVQAARETGRIFTVGHQSRRHPALRRLKGLVEAGHLGAPRLIEGNASSPTGREVPSGHWRASVTECPGGPLMQLGVHYVDNFQHCLGPIVTVSAWMSRRAGPVDPDTTASVFGFASGAAGYLGSSYVIPHARWIRLSGEEGWALFQSDGSLVAQRAGATKTELIVPPAVDREAVLQQMLAEEIAEFAECIRHERVPEISGEAAARNLAVVLAAVESHRRRSPVEVDQLLRNAGLLR